MTSIRCPVCGSHDIQLTLDLRDQPLANYFMKTTTEALRAEKFPLALVHCRECHHLHLSQLVSRKRLFSDYLYVSGTSKTLLKHFEWLAQKIQADVETLPLEGARTKRAVLELACNDGSQLDAFARLGWKTYGVDPAANIVPTAVAKGHQAKVGFWGAQSVWPPEGTPVVLDAIVAQNVLAHVPSPTQFLKDCAAAMGPRTLLFIQTSQCHMHEDGQFDTAYHEHLSFFTSHSFERAATAAQLAVLSFETTPIHGISCLWKLKRADGESSGALAGGTSLKAKLDEEVRLGITTDFFYDRYRMRAEETSAWLDAQLAALSAAGYRLGGYGAAAKGMVLLHFMLGRGGAHAAARSLEFVLDDAPMKQGTYCPGTTIPVRPTRSLESVFTADDKPLALVIFAWNFWAELSGNMQKLLAAAPPTRSGRPRVVLAVLPFPTPRVVTLAGDTVAQMHYQPAQIDAAYRGWVRAAGARRAVLLTSFADDAAVLPHWIRHHAHMFDEATLLDCGSADASRGIIEREAPPTWRVVRAPNASAALRGCAHHLASHAARARPHDWVFPLQLHELLVHGDLRGALAALDGQAGPPPLAATLQFPALQMAGASAARPPADRFTDLATQRSQYHAAAAPPPFRAKTGAAKGHASGQVQALSSKDGFVLVYPPSTTAHGNSNRGGGRGAAAAAYTGDLSELYEVIAMGPRLAGVGGPGLGPTREAFALHRIFHEAGLAAPPHARARQPGSEHSSRPSSSAAARMVGSAAASQITAVAGAAATMPATAEHPLRDALLVLLAIVLSAPCTFGLALAAREALLAELPSATHEPAAASEATPTRSPRKSGEDGRGGAVQSYLFAAFLVVAFLALNSSLSILNRWALGAHGGLSFPLIVTGVHMITGTAAIAPLMALHPGYYACLKREWARRWRALSAIGVMNVTQIALNNSSLVSLELSMNQIVRATGPVLTALIAIYVENRVPTPRAFACLLTVALGVMVTVFKGMARTSALGLAMVALSTVTQCTQISLSGRLMAGSGGRLDAFQMTFYTGPVACLTIAPFALAVEARAFSYALASAPTTVLAFLLGSSALAVLYNVALFQALKTLSTTGTAVLGNVKIVLLLLLSAIALGELRTWSAQQLVGVVVTFGASAVYSMLKVKST